MKFYMLVFVKICLILKNNVSNNLLKFAIKKGQAYHFARPNFALFIKVNSIFGVLCTKYYTRISINFQQTPQG